MIDTVRAYYWYFIGTKIQYLWGKLKLKHKYIKYGTQHDSIDAQELSELILKDRTRKWRLRAWKNHIELPEHPQTDDENEYWYNSEFGHGRLLTNKGVRYILDQYRREKGAQREVWVKWLTLIFAGIAATGTLALNLMGLS